jgi:transcriptional regulator with XRE-family HTH domain
MPVAEPTTLAVDIVILRIELARQQLTQAELAQALGVAPTTLSSWLGRRHPAPNGLAARIEQALGLPAGALAPGRSGCQAKRR